MSLCKTKVSFANQFNDKLPRCLPAGRQGGIGRPVCRQAGALGDKMFFIYVISSISRNYIYVGLTQNVEIRVGQHNSGKEKTTRPYAPFELFHTECFSSRIEARNREKYLKSGVGKEWIKANFKK